MKKKVKRKIALIKAKKKKKRTYHDKEYAAILLLLKNKEKEFKKCVHDFSATVNDAVAYCKKKA